MLELKNVSKTYDKFIIEDINLKVEKGEFLALLGPSGCGKTTLLKIIAGLEDYNGEIFLNNKEIQSIKAKKRKISMVFQDALLFPNMNVEENISFGLKMQKIPKEERLKKSRKFLRDLGLENFAKRSTTELSGGQKQRVSLGRALIVEPDIILMDEPFSALDYNLRSSMQSLIKNLHEKNNLTIVFVTHDREEAFYLSDKIAIMKTGKILQLGKGIELYNKPAEKYIAEFLGMKNIIKGKIEGGKFIAGDFILKIKEKIKEKETNIVIKPETLKVSKKLKGENYFEAELKEIYFKNGFYHISVEIGNKKIYIIQIENKEFKRGDKVFVNYKNEKFIFLDK